MSAYLVARFNIIDSAKLKTYSQLAGPIIKSYGGTLLFKGGVDDVLTENKAQLANIVVFEFPSQDKLDMFYTSAAYQALKPAREAGANMMLSGHLKA